MSINSIFCECRNGHKISKKSHGTVAFSTNSTAKAGLIARTMLATRTTTTLVALAAYFFLLFIILEI